MIRALEQNRGEELSEREQPSTEYIAMLLEEIEQDELQAHSLMKSPARRRRWAHNCSRAWTNQVESESPGSDPKENFRPTRKN